MASQIPNYSSLPLNKNDPPLSAWGLYGDNDQLGTLNRLSKHIVKKSSTEIKTGETISFDWQLDGSSDLNFFGRCAFQQKIISLPKFCVNDDEWTFNTQSSSQWDGLRHFSYLERRRFYNGATLADFGVKDPQHSTPQKPGIPTANGIGAFAQHGIVGRGILLDWERWRAVNRADDPEVFTNKTRIPLSELLAVASSQGTQVKFGDILLIRSGYLQTYKQTPRATIEALRHVELAPAIGVEQSEEMAEWLWTNFAAVAGDQPSFESFPPQHISERVPHFLHEVLLAGWGMPIGELFDLEALAKHCEKVGLWEFFLVSKPCDVPGGVASPPNAVAIF